MNKKFAYTLLSLSVLGLAGCSMIPGQGTEKKAETTQTSKVSKEETTEKSDVKQAEKDGRIILNAVLSDSSSGFNSVMGQSVKDWKADLTDNYVDEEVGQYTPEEDYTLTLQNEEFDPEKILTLFDETRWSLLASIGTDYEINDVEVNGDEATITFTSRGIATLDLANTINLIKTNLFADGLAGVDAAGDSTDPVVKKAYTMLNDFLFYWCFDREYLDFGYTDPQEFTMILEKKGSHWILSEDNFKELRGELFVQEYSKDGAPLRSENSSVKNNKSATSSSKTKTS